MTVPAMPPKGVTQRRLIRGLKPVHKLYPILIAS